MAMSKTGFFTGGLAALKTWVIIAHLVSWNIFFGIAIFINGFGPVNNPIALILVGIICLWTGFFFLSVPLSSKVSDFVLRKTLIMTCLHNGEAYVFIQGFE